MSTKKIWNIMAIATGSLFSLNKALAVQINTNLPGPLGSSQSSNIGAFVNNFYTFALMISGVLAFGAIVFGGMKYTLAAGNPSDQNEGKAWVTSALLGLLLLSGAYMILNLISPNLVNLTPPTLPQAPVSSQTSGSNTTVGSGCTKDSDCGDPAQWYCAGNACYPY